MSANFNDTTPAAPSGKANVKWQHDGVNVSAYVDTGSGSGSVTSVDLTMPAEFSVSGNPVTTSGTIAVSKATQSANQIYAGPTTGGAAAPTFRALVAADIPTIPDSGISYANESANRVFAGPTTGGAAAPTFRVLVAADIPAIAESGVTNLVTDLAAKAPLASPTFTGTPAAPTATAGTNTTQIATTAFVTSAVSTGVSGVIVPSTESGASHNFLTAYNATTGAFTKAQPTESDVVNLVSDLAAKAPTVRSISTTAPLTGGGDLSADRTLAVSNATSSTVGVVKPDNSTLTISGGVLSAVSTVISGGAGAGFSWGGDGSDGAVSMDGTNTYASFTTTTGAAPNLVYTLTRDMFATTLSVSTSKTLNTANFRIFATTSVSVSGTVQNNGGNATAASGGANAQISAGAGLPQGWGASGQTGANAKAGTTAAGGVGNNGGAGLTAGTVVVVGSATGSAGGGPGGTGGTSGANTGGSGGTGGAAGTIGTAATSPPREPTAALAGRLQVWSSTAFPFVASASSGSGASGGAGGGDGTFSGGNGGAGGGAGGAGGNMVIAAPAITVNSGGVISCNGGTGGNGSTGANGAGGNAGGGGGGAGGSGGPGGLLMLIYHTYSNAGTVQAAGGSGGSGGANGTNRGTSTGGTSGASGNTGTAGVVITIPV